jgi:hypothetical protein
VDDVALHTDIDGHAALMQLAAKLPDESGHAAFRFGRIDRGQDAEALDAERLFDLACGLEHLIELLAGEGDADATEKPGHHRGPENEQGLRMRLLTLRRGRDDARFGLWKGLLLG